MTTHQQKSPVMMRGMNQPLGPNVSHATRSAGFTLIEMMIVVAIVAILAAIAVPSYTSYITKSKRVAAQGCLSQIAGYMERYYTTNLRYDQDASKVANPYLMPDCAGAAQTGDSYDYPAPAGAALTATAYTITAVPKGAQQKRDTKCGTLSLDQSGQRSAASQGCW